MVLLDEQAIEQRYRMVIISDDPLTQMRSVAVELVLRLIHELPELLQMRVATATSKHL